MDSRDSSIPQYLEGDISVDASDERYCTACQKSKHKSLFAKSIKPHTPLADITNERDGSKRFYQQCRPCRTQKARHKQKKDSVLREERNNSKLQSMTNCSWEQLVNIIDGGFIF
jgi:hypothetical protein